MNEEKNEKQQNTELAPTNSNNQTISPTMIDNEDSGNLEKKQDLSAIIPTQESSNESSDAITLESKDTTLKTDGVITIGIINGEEISIDEKIQYPNQIDIESRKIQKMNELKSKKKKKVKKEISSEKKKSQNITSIIVLVIIAALGGFVYYYFNHKTEDDFIPLNVTIELGDKLPIRTKEYVKPGVGSADSIDEMDYKINTSDVKIDEVGEYKFTVTFNNITKTGTISIVDTTAPELLVKEVTITEGTTFAPETFVDSCKDLSGCNFSFEDPNTVTKYTEAGEYDVYVVAKDPYDNKQMKKAKLTIEQTGMVKKYIKTESYNYEKGYELTTTYDLHFTGFMGDSILLKGTKIEEYKYTDSTKFNSDFEKYNGLENYKIDKENQIIVYTTSITSINNNSRMELIVTYLEGQGFQES